MKITETFRNSEYIKLNSDLITVENKAFLSTVTVGTYIIKWLFTATVSELSNFDVDALTVVTVTYKFQLEKDGVVYWWDGAWTVTTEGNLAEANSKAEIQANIATFITSESEFNLIIVIDQQNATISFEVNSFEFDTNAGINNITGIRKNLFDVKVDAYPDYMINNDIKQADGLTIDELVNFVDFSSSPVPKSAIEVAKYQTYVKIFEAIYYEQIKDGENITDIVYWSGKYDALIKKIKDGDVASTSTPGAVSTESNADSTHFGQGCGGRPLNDDSLDKFTHGGGL